MIPFNTGSNTSIIIFKNIRILKKRKNKRLKVGTIEKRVKIMLVDYFDHSRLTFTLSNINISDIEDGSKNI